MCISKCFPSAIIVDVYLFYVLFIFNNVYNKFLINQILSNNSISICKFCNILSSLIIFIEIVYNTTLCYVILYLIVVSKNSTFYLSLYSSSLFVFNFLIVVIIVEASFIDFNIIYTMNFSIVLLIWSSVFCYNLYLYTFLL